MLNRAQIITIVLAVITIALSVRVLITNSDIYQKHQQAKILRSYLSGTNQDLVLKRVITSEEPDIVTFEVPVKYGLLHSPDFLRLVVDAR